MTYVNFNEICDISKLIILLYQMQVRATLVLSIFSFICSIISLVCKIAGHRTLSQENYFNNSKQIYFMIKYDRLASDIKRIEFIASIIAIFLQTVIIILILRRNFKNQQHNTLKFSWSLIVEYQIMALTIMGQLIAVGHNLSPIIEIKYQNEFKHTDLISLGFQIISLVLLIILFAIKNYAILTQDISEKNNSIQKIVQTQNNQNNMQDQTKKYKLTINNIEPSINTFKPVYSIIQTPISQILEKMENQLEIHKNNPVSLSDSLLHKNIANNETKKLKINIPRLRLQEIKPKQTLNILDISVILPKKIVKNSINQQNKHE